MLKKIPLLENLHEWDLYFHNEPIDGLIQSRFKSFIFLFHSFLIKNAGIELLIHHHFFLCMRHDIFIYFKINRINQLYLFITIQKNKTFISSKIAAHYRKKNSEFPFYSLFFAYKITLKIDSSSSSVSNKCIVHIRYK